MAQNESAPGAAPRHTVYPNPATSDSPIRPFAVPDMTEIARQPSDGSKTKDMDFILDVPLELHAELGRSRVTIHELLQLKVGAILEMNKLAGEPLDVFLNSNLVARGEAVIINEKYGVRLTDIISGLERRKLKGG